MGALKGYKTYITAGLAIAGAAAAYLVGDATLVQVGQIVSTALIGVFVHHAVVTNP